jgi:hypothetical protein
MSLHSTATSASRSTWRHRTSAPVFAPLPSALLATTDVDGLGRCVLAKQAHTVGDCLVAERPIVIGRCSTLACPGCFRPAGQHCSRHCRWAKAEATGAQLANAIAWHRHLCAERDTVPIASRENHIRVACLLALTVQAAADEELFEWLLTALRPSKERPDPADPLVISTMSFASRFCETMLPPRRYSPPGDPAHWTLAVFKLLLRLQTNLFYLDTTTVGLYPSAWLVEHCCAPNAKVSNDASGTLRLTALRPIERDDRLTFCYCDLDPGRLDLLHEELDVRRARLVKELGFYCHCAACAAEGAARARAKARGARARRAHES